MYMGRLSVIRATLYESAKWNSYIPVYNESENSKRSIDKYGLNGLPEMATGWDGFQLCSSFDKYGWNSIPKMATAEMGFSSAVSLYLNALFENGLKKFSAL